MTALDVAAALPDVETLRRRCLAVSMLDAILSPEWEYRYYSHTAEWGGGTAATEIRDGSGNDCFIVYASEGAFIKGFDHESPMSPARARPPRLWPGLIEGVPVAFLMFLTEPAFADPDGLLNASFCIWRHHRDTQWRTGTVDYTEVSHLADPDGAHHLLGVLTDPTPGSYLGWATAYFGVVVDPMAVAHVFDLRPLTEDVVRRLNAHTTLEDLTSDIVTSGYPNASG